MKDFHVKQLFDHRPFKSLKEDSDMWAEVPDSFGVLEKPEDKNKFEKGIEIYMEASKENPPIIK